MRWTGVTQSRNGYDFSIIALTFILLCFGVVMVHSASSVLSDHTFHDSFYFLKRQILWASVGIIAMMSLANYDYHNWRRFAPKLAVIAFILLVVVLLPGVGRNVNGSRAWLGIGSFGVQPSEFAKMVMVLFLAHLLADSGDRMQSFFKGFLPPLFLSLVCVGLIMLEPDLGQSVVIMGATIVLLFVAGARVRHIGALGGVGLLGFAGLVAAAPYRIDRITSFLNPWKDPLGTGYQIIQSLFAIGSGGLLGLGLGHSRQKYLYLPEPQTDFIYSILSEELGLLGAVTVLLLFAALIWRGIRTAIYAPDEFGALLAAGITGMIGVQVLINVGVVTGSIPATGVTLPFLSYGGSSLTLMLASVGILLNISKQAAATVR